MGECVIMGQCFGVGWCKGSGGDGEDCAEQSEYTECHWTPPIKMVTLKAS